MAFGQPILQANAALSEMHAEDQRRGVDPLAPSRVVELGPPAPPPAPFVIPPPPWSVNARPEAVERPAGPERDVTEELSTPGPEAHRVVAATPRLNEVRKWQAGQMRPG